MNIKRLQQDLTSLGFNPGEADGIMGPQTVSAIMTFQSSRDLTVDGIVGPETWAAISDSQEPRATAPGNTPWMKPLLRRKGWHERKDFGSLTAWLKNGVTGINPIKVPWCGDAVETSISETLPGEQIPENPLLALNWLKFGVPCDPQYGAVLVFWRGSPSSWKGHVGFYYGETSDGKYFLVLGGNQANKISITKIAKTRLREGGSRWPMTAPMGKALTSVKDMDVAVSTNEA